MGTPLDELYFTLGLDDKKFNEAVKKAKGKVASLGNDIADSLKPDVSKIAKQVQAELDKLQSSKTGGTATIQVEIDKTTLTNVQEQLDKLKAPITATISVEYDLEKFQAVETTMKNFGKRVGEAVTGGLKGGGTTSAGIPSQPKRGVGGWLDKVSGYLLGEGGETSSTSIQNTIHGVDDLSEALGGLAVQVEKLSQVQQEAANKAKGRKVSTGNSEEDETKRQLAQLRRLEEGVRRWENVKASIQSAKVDKDSGNYQRAIALIDDYIDKLKDAQASAGKFTAREMTEMLGQNLSGSVQEASRYVKAQKDVEKAAFDSFTKQQAQIQRFEESIRRIQNVKAKMNASDVDKSSIGYKGAITVLDKYISKLESAKGKAGEFTKREMADLTGQNLSGQIAEAERLVRVEKELARQKQQSSKSAAQAEKEEIQLKRAKLQLQKEEANLRKANASAKKAELQKDKESVRLKKEKVSLRKKLNKGFKDASNWATQLNNQVNNLISIYSLEHFIRNLYTIGGEFQKQQIALQNMIGDADKGDAIYERMKDLAVVSPFTFSDLASYAKQMAAYGIEYENLYDTTKRLADISAGVGVDMGRLILAFGQVRSAAVLRGQELRQFTEAGIPLVAELAKKFSELEGRVVATGEVFDKISKREVSFGMVKDILYDMTDPGGKFFETQERLAESLAGKWSNLKDAWDIMMADIANGNNSVLSGLADILNTIIRNFEIWLPFVSGMVVALGVLRGAIAAVNIVASVNPWILAGSLIAGAVTTIISLASETETVVELLTRVNRELEKAKAEAEDRESSASRYLDILSREAKIEEDKFALYKKQKAAFDELVQMYPKLMENLSVEEMTLEKIAEKRKEIADYTKNEVLASYDKRINETLAAYTEKKRSTDKILSDSGKTIDSFPETKREIDDLYNAYIQAMNAKEEYEQSLLDKNKPATLANWQEIAKKMTESYKEQKIFFKDPTAEHDIYNYFDHLSEVYKEAEGRYEKTTDKTLRASQKRIMDAANAINMAIGGRTFSYKKDNKNAKEQASLDAKAYVEELKRALAEEAQKWNLYKKLFDATGNKDLSMRIAFEDSMTFVSPYLESLKKKLEEKAKELKVDFSVSELLGMGEKQLMADERIPKDVREKVAKALGAIIEAYHNESKRLKNETIDSYVEIINASKDFAKQIADVDRDLRKQLETLASIHGKDTPAYKQAEAEAIKKAEEKKVGINFEQFKESSDWVKVFDDLNRVSDATLDNMITKIEEFAKQGKMSEEVTKQIVEAMAKLHKEVIERNPFEGFGDAWSRLRNLKKGVLTESGMVRFGKGTKDDPYTFKNNKDVQNEIAEANDDLEKSALAVADKFQAVSDAANMLSGIFDALGVDISGLSDVLGGIAGGATSGASIAGAFGYSGPWGAIAGAAIGAISSLFAQVDKNLQKEIESSERREKEIGNLAKNLESALNRNMGGIYSMKIDDASSAGLKEIVDKFNQMKAAESKLQSGEISWDLIKQYREFAHLQKDTIETIKKALEEDSYYDAQLAALKVQRDEVQKQMQLEDEKKKTDKSKMEDYKQQIHELDESIAHFAEDMANTLYGIDFKDWAEQLASAMVDAWASGEDAAEAYKDTVNDILKDLGVSMISQQILEPMLNKTMKEFLVQFDKDNGKLTDSSLEILAGMADEAEYAAKATEAYLEGLKKLGIDLSGKSESESASGLSKSIQGVTEDTANLLGSYLNAMRADVSVKRSLVEQLVNEAVPKINYLAEAQLQQLQMVVANTKRNADAADKIYDLVNRVVDKGGNKLRV